MSNGISLEEQGYNLISSLVVNKIVPDSKKLLLPLFIRFIRRECCPVCKAAMECTNGDKQVTYLAELGESVDGRDFIDYLLELDDFRVPILVSLVAEDLVGILEKRRNGSSKPASDILTTPTIDIPEAG